MVAKDRRRRVVLVAALSLLALTSVAGTLKVLRARRVLAIPAPTHPAHVASDHRTAFDCSLSWLARHQDSRGSWSTDLAAVCTTCRGSGRHESPVRLTAECVLAFLGAGYTPRNRALLTEADGCRSYRAGEAVRRGLAFLMTCEHDGVFSRGEDAAVDNALATLALAEAYGLTNAMRYRTPAQKGINRLVERRRGTEDLEATTWNTLAEIAADLAGLDVGCMTFPRELEAQARVDPAGPEEWSAHRPGIAMRSLCRTLVGGIRDPAGTLPLLGDLPGQEPEVDYDHWFWATFAIFEADAVDGPSSRTWGRALERNLLPRQNTVGCLDGSWDPDGARRVSWAHAGGRVHATAINTLTCAVYYRYGSVFDARH